MASEEMEQRHKCACEVSDTKSYRLKKWSASGLGNLTKKDKPFCFETKLFCYIIASILLLRNEGPRVFIHINMFFFQSVNPFLHDLLTLPPVAPQDGGMCWLCLPATR